MTTRRAILIGALSGLAGVAITAPTRASTYGRVMKAGKPKLIKGKPDMVDFGHGLLVPMSKDAFQVLWEGDDRWMTYGHGFGHNQAAAMGQAEEAAIGTMKLFLLTLAFTPERLVRIPGGGWKLKSGSTTDLVRGNVDLPGRPIMPTTDQVPDNANSDDNNDPNGESTHATTGWVVWKTEVTLDTVRRNAQLVAN